MRAPWIHCMAERSSEKVNRQWSHVMVDAWVRMLICQWQAWQVVWRKNVRFLLLFVHTSFFFIVHASRKWLVKLCHNHSKYGIIWRNKERNRGNVFIYYSHPSFPSLLPPMHLYWVLDKEQEKVKPGLICTIIKINFYFTNLKWTHTRIEKLQCSN